MVPPSTIAIAAKFSAMSTALVAGQLAVITRCPLSLVRDEIVVTRDASVFELVNASLVVCLGVWCALPASGFRVQAADHLQVRLRKSHTITELRRSSVLSCQGGRLPILAESTGHIMHHRLVVIRLRNVRRFNFKCSFHAVLDTVPVHLEILVTIHTPVLVEHPNRVGQLVDSDSTRGTATCNVQVHILRTVGRSPICGGVWVARHGINHALHGNLSTPSAHEAFRLTNKRVATSTG
mmetsp:Transcript_44456/g.94774  ORF Transcript_44456/g.94774 Transcript_44456/m.94774 type:complete len:237 (-) Transcript_44456:801-1511(-)